MRGGPQISRIGADAETSTSSVLLRLWLAGYHTPSLNVTTGAHWTRYFRLKQGAAGALLEALPRTSEMARALVVLSGMTGKARQRGTRVLGLSAAAGGPASLPSGAGEGTRAPITLRYVRVTTRPLDFENLAGSTKALTDCLKEAFPGWLPDDAPEFVCIEHAQERVRKKCEEGTWVVMTVGEWEGRKETQKGAKKESELLKL